MTLILAIILGLIAGQYIKLTVDPKALEVLGLAWSKASEKAPVLKALAVEKLTEVTQKAKARRLPKAPKSPAL